MSTIAAAEPAAVSSLNWIVDGRVHASARLGNTLYIGGDFTSVAPGPNAIGAVHAVSPTTGALVNAPAFPLIDGFVRRIVPDAAGGYFLVGPFTTVGGVSQGGVAHIVSDGTRDAGFAPQINGTVSHLASAGGTVFVGGFFTTVGGLPRAGLAAVDGATGQPTAWLPALPRAVIPTMIEVLGSRVLVGRVAGTGEPNLLAFDVTSGALLWEQRIGSGRNIYDVLVVGGRVLIGGEFETLGIGNVAAIDPTTGILDPTWITTGVGEVTELGAFGPTAYASSFRGLAAYDVATGARLPWSPSTSFPPTSMAVLPNGNVVVGGVRVGRPPRAVVQIDPTGTILPWISEVSVDQVTALAVDASGALVVAGTPAARQAVPRANLAAFDLVSGTLLPWAPSASLIVQSLAVDGQTVYVGGNFDRIGSTARAGVAAVDATTGQLLPWAPLSSGQVYQLLVHGPYLYIRGLFAPTPGIRNLARVTLATGVVDNTWRPGESAATFAMTVGFGSLYVVATPDLALPATLRSADLVSGSTAPWRVDVEGGEVRTLALDGDTLYLGGLFSRVNGVARNRLAAVDRRTGTLLGFQPPPGLVVVDGVTVADSRVVHIGSYSRFDGTYYTQLGATNSTGTTTGWSPNYRQWIAPSSGGSRVAVFGDTLVATGMFGTLTPTPLQALATFPLDGARGLSNLRSVRQGPLTALTWDPPSVAPSGGFVMEGGTTAGASTFALPLGAATSFTAAVPNGDFFVRVRTAGAAGGVEETSNEVLVSGRCTTAPAPPSGLTATLAATAVTLAWAATDEIVTRYTLTAGSIPGADSITVALPGGPTSFSAEAPPGTYYVRLQATNACGSSARSSEVFFTVGAPVPLPQAPTGLSAVAAGATVTLQWLAPGGTVSGYVLEAGTAAGLADITAVALGPAAALVVTSVPPGRYFVRVRAVNAAGSGPPSADVVVRVP